MAADGPTAGDIAIFGPFRLVAAERLLEKDGAPIAIGGRALDLLIALTDRAGQVVSMRELIDLVWPDVIVEEANLRVHIASLRKAIGDGKDGSRYIVNVPGRGYSFIAPVRRTIADGAAPIAAPTGPRRSRTLPAPPQLVVGRSETVAALSSLLLSRRFVSVVGPGGIGKTTVAVAVADALRQELGDDGICFVDLGSLTDPADVPRTVASALGCFVQGPDPEPYINAFLADKRILIILDNCEHVIEASARLSERLFFAAPSVHLLTTSREALRVEGENVHLLMPLDSPLDDAPTAAQALASPAVQLFMERATSSGYRTELSDAEAPIVAEICRRLDGIALAIELVASRVGTYGIQGTAVLLDTGAGLLLQGRRGALPRHQTLQALIAWSFNLLTPTEQRVLARLSVFVGHFTLTAAHSVVADGVIQTVNNAIASLVDKSLVWISSTGGGSYYRLLETTRTFAAAKLAESGETEAIARRHASYFAILLEEDATKGLAFDGYGLTTHAFYVGNVRSGLVWSFSNPGDPSIGIELAASAAPLFLGLSMLDECRQWCRRALGALQEADRGTSRELELQEALAMSTMYARGNSTEVRAAIERGLELSERVRDGRRHLQLLSGLYIFLTRQNDFGGALAVARRASAVAKASGGPAENAMTEWMLGGSYHLTGNQAAGLRHCRRGVKLASDYKLGRVGFFGHDHHISGLATLARCLWLRGFPDQGCRVAREALKRAERSAHPVSYCIALIYLVPVLHWSGDFEGASEYTGIAIEQAAKYSLAPYQAVSQALQGELQVATGDPHSGVDLLRKALRAMEANRYQIVTLSTLRALAEALALSGRPSEALATIDEAVARAEQVNETLWRPDLLRARGEILLAQPRPDLSGAEDALLRSIDAARKQSALSWELRAAVPLARMWGEHGRGTEARSMLEGAYQRFGEGFGTRDLIAAQRLLDELTSAPSDPRL